MSRAGGNALMKLLSGDKKKKKTKKGAAEDLGLVRYASCIAHFCLEILFVITHYLFLFVFIFLFSRVTWHVISRFIKNIGSGLQKDSDHVTSGH